MATELVDYSGLTLSPQKYYAYNAMDEERQFDIAGKTIRFCPRGEDRYGAGPGVTPLTSIPGREPGPKGRMGPLEARNVVVFFFGADGRSGPVAKAGIRLLTGDPTKDPAVIKEAEAAAVEKRYLDMKAKVRWHEKACMAAKEAKVDPPIPSKDVLEAYKFVREHEGGVIATHPCPVCNHPAYSEGERLGHLQDIHGIAAATEDPTKDAIEAARVTKNDDTDLRATLAEMQKELSELKAKKKPGRPRKEANATS